MENQKITNIRLEIEALRIAANSRAVKFGKSPVDYARFKEDTKAIQIYNEVLAIIDAHLNWTIDVENLLSRDIGRFVVYTGDREPRRGRIKAWSTGLDLVYVVFEDIEADDWIENKSNRCEARFLRFESMNFVKYGE